MAASSSSSSSSKLSADAAEFVPSGLRAGADDASQTSTVSEVHQCITNAISTLIYSPECFSEVALLLSSDLSALIQDDDSLTVVIDELVDQGIAVPNFQYLIARLCTFLFQNLPEGLEKSFRNGLLQRCKLEFDHKEELAKTADGRATLVRLTLLVSELMSQMKTASAETINVFPAKVIDLLSCLLSVISDETVKGIVQTIKLTGLTLEKHQPEKVDQLFNKLKKVTADETLTRSQRAMILSIIELRGSGYMSRDGSQPVDDSPSGTQSASATTEDQAAEDLVEDVEEFEENPEVYYSNLAEEEAIMQRFGEGDFEIVNDGDEQYVVPREMDPDMEDAFESFISETGRR